MSIKRFCDVCDREIAIEEDYAIWKRYSQLTSAEMSKNMMCNECDATFINGITKGNPPYDPKTIPNIQNLG